jgi:hypothetical protein
MALLSLGGVSRSRMGWSRMGSSRFFPLAEEQWFYSPVTWAGDDEAISLLTVSRSSLVDVGNTCLS